MFEYRVKYLDGIYHLPCKVKGRVKAHSIFEAKVKVKEFYPNIIYVEIAPILIEDYFEYDGEWDI